MREWSTTSIPNGSDKTDTTTATVTRRRRLLLLGASLVLVLGVSLMLENEQRTLVALVSSSTDAIFYKGDEPYNSSAINKYDESLLEDYDAIYKLNAPEFVEEMEGTDDDEYSDDTYNGHALRHRKRLYPAAATDFACTWAPEQDDACVEHVSRQLTTSLRRPNVDMGPNNDNDDEQKTKSNAPRHIPLNRRRWIFLGDSTMAMLWRMSPLQSYLTEKAVVKRDCGHVYNCDTTYAGRCGINEPLQVPRSATEWTRPNFTRAEGPVHNGWYNPYCHDCAGCNSVTLTCRPKHEEQEQSNRSQCPSNTARNTSQAMYGGFVAIEFARDVEFPSLDYRTTQETVVRGYLEQQWNAPNTRLLTDFGRPICVVSAGFHDAAIPNITQASYMANVAWYVNLLLDHACAHVVWLGNTCPQTDNYEQKQLVVHQWNHAVRDHLWRYHNDRTSYIDVYNASIPYARRDNLHMAGQWYNLLGYMFLKLFASSK
jgi:hypothetical protein